MDFYPSSGAALEWDASSVALRPTNQSLTASLCEAPSSTAACASKVHTTFHANSTSACIPRASFASDPATNLLTIISFLPPNPDPDVTLTFAPNSICFKDENDNQVSKFPQNTLIYKTSLPAKPDNPNPSGNTTDTPEEIPIYGIGVYVTDLSSLSLKDSTFYADLRVYVLKYYKTYTAETKDDVLRNALDPSNPSSCQFKDGEKVSPPLPPLQPLPPPTTNPPYPPHSGSSSTTSQFQTHQPS